MRNILRWGFRRALLVSVVFVVISGMGWGEEASRSTSAQTTSLYDMLPKEKVLEGGQYVLRVSTLHFASQLSQAWFIVRENLITIPRGATYYHIINFGPLKKEFENIGLSGKTAELLVRFMEVSQDYSNWGGSYEKSQRQKENWGRPLTPAEEKRRQERMALERKMLRKLEPVYNTIIRKLQKSLTPEQEKIFIDWYQQQLTPWGEEAYQERLRRRKSEVR